MALPNATELMIILGGVFLLFGGQRLPKLGQGLGEGIRNFKKGLAGNSEDEAGDTDKIEGSPPKKKVEGQTDQASDQPKRPS